MGAIPRSGAAQPRGWNKGFVLYCSIKLELTDNVRLGYYVTNPMLRYSSLTLAGAIRLSLA